MHARPWPNLFQAACLALVMAMCGCATHKQETIPQGKPAHGVDNFSDLKPEDVLIVRFSSSGCFHGYTKYLTFRETDALTVSITNHDPAAGADAASDATADQPVVRRLSKTDVEGLDRLLRFYRSKPKGYCTTADVI